MSKRSDVQNRVLSPTTILLGLVVLLSLQVMALWMMGHPTICKCGYVKLWHGVAKSAENSQHLTDWYTPSHVIHGFLFYAALHVLMPTKSIGTRLLLALGIEIGWEILENTDFIINRYRTATIALDYYGDSIVNSVSDAVAMMAGFVIARVAPVAATITAAVAFELFTGWSIRDNLTLNVLMLISPIDAVKTWQGGA